MGRVWIWFYTKRSPRSMCIKIPKNVLEQINKELPKSFYVAIFEDKKDVDHLIEVIEEGRMR